MSSEPGPSGQVMAQVSSEVVTELRRGCEAVGFDLVQPLQVGWYNALVGGSLRLEDYGSPAHLAVVIGNTRALWPRFLAALRADARLLAAPHPLYRYTEQAIGAVCAGLPQPLSLRWSHAGGAGLVAMQRLAQVAGLAYLSESQLSVHPQYGPWIGLRAALSFALPGPSGPPPQLPHPCGGCAGQCRPAFERALAAASAVTEATVTEATVTEATVTQATVTQATVTEATVQQSWQLWLACRDACPTGRDHRYSEAQIHYHYLKDRQQLRNACLASASSG